MYTELRESCNYTCTVSNSVGQDEVYHVVHVTAPPAPPTVVVGQSTAHALNLTIDSTEDGGAPILGKLLSLTVRSRKSSRITFSRIFF